MRSKASLGSSREVEHDCGVSFVNCFYLVLLIIGQNFCATCASTNQTGPETKGKGRLLFLIWQCSRHSAVALLTMHLPHRYAAELWFVRVIIRSDDGGYVSNRTCLYTAS